MWLQRSVWPAGFLYAASTALVLGAAVLTLPAAAEGDASYALGAGDVVAVTVYGRNELSGRFPISPDGTIGFPLLGNVNVAGLTQAQFSDRLNELLAEHLPGLSVAVSVAQYAPVFIVGDVQNPGRYEFRPGMTTLELVALGGGTRRAAAALENTQLQMIAARQDFADLDLQIFGQETTAARLRSELDGSDFSPKATAAHPDPVRQVVMERMVAGERRTFDIRKAALKSEDEALVAQQRSYDDEIGNVAQSIALHGQEIDLLLQDVAAQKELAARGLTAKSNAREAERNLSSMRRDALELGSYLARAQQNKLAIEQKRVALIATRRSEAVRQLQEVEINVARMQARQRSLLETMSELALMSGENALSSEARRPEYSILRLTSTDYQETAGGERTTLKPGDIVRVVLPRLPAPHPASLH